MRWLPAAQRHQLFFILNVYLIRPVSMPSQLLIEDAGHMQLRRIALREWALVLVHQPAGAWHCDLQE